jgi:hypothetical protein
MTRKIQESRIDFTPSTERQNDTRPVTLSQTQCLRNCCQIGFPLLDTAAITSLAQPHVSVLGWLYMYSPYLDKRMYGNNPAHKVTDHHVFFFVFV